MAALSGVPIALFGVTVGYMSFEDDGSFEIESSLPSALGVELKAQLERGEFPGMALVPQGVPMPPQPPFTVIDSTGTQVGDGNSQVNHF